MNDQYLGAAIENLKYAIDRLIGKDGKGGPMKDLNENLSILNSSMPQLTELNNNLKRQLFVQEWNMAMAYFAGKRVGPLPSEDQMIEWIVKTRLQLQEKEDGVKTKGLN